MGFSFFERMSGTLVDEHGAAHPVDLELKCEVPRARNVSRGVVQLSGLIRVTPWARDVPIRGTLKISFLVRRTLEYEIFFQDEAGVDYCLSGRKNIGPGKLFFGMTELHSELRRGTIDAGELLADGTMYFRMDDLLSFASSLGVGTTVSRTDLEGAVHRGGAQPPLLNATERVLLRALGEALVEPSDIVCAVNDKSVARAERVLANLPPYMQDGFRTGLKTLDVLARTHHGGGFVQMDNGTRREFLENSSIPGLHLLRRVLGLPLMVGHFGRRDYLDAIGVPDYANPVREARERWMGQVSTPDDLESLTNYECDVVVVGTGAGGAPLAAVLAERGLVVVLVEEGSYAGRAEFAGDPDERIGRFWRDSGMNLVLGNSPLMVPTGKVVGGSTAINSGTSFGTPAGVLKEWRESGFPEDFEPDQFARYVERVRSELEVEDAREPWLGEIASRIAKGAEAMRLNGEVCEHGPLPRNAPGCDGQGLCAVGCPTGAKRSSDVSWVPRALKAGAFCFTGMSVRHVLMRGQKAVGIEARGQDRHGVQKTLHLKARAVVLACGTLQTPLMLRANGINLPRIGKGLSVHPALGFNALFKESLGEPWKAIPQSYGVHGLVSERVRFEGFYVPPGLMASTLPFTGPELTHWMENIDRLGQFGFMVRDRNLGRVTRGPKGRPLLWYKVTPDVLDLYVRGSAALAEMMILGGAEQVSTGIQGVPILRTVEDARSLTERNLKPWQFQAMAFHPLGTCAMGTSTKTGVVDFDHRVFGTHNLYVVDGSSVPTSLGVNPQVTIMSMALRAADRVHAHLSGS